MGCPVSKGPEEGASNKLIGKVPNVALTIENVPVRYILDTGSNVSLMKHSFFLSHFAKEGKKLRDAGHWLTLEAANGLNIPYLGYVILQVAVGEAELMDCGFLIVKDHCLTDSDGVVGMNIISRLWHQMDKCPIASMTSEPSQQQAWTMAFKICSRQAHFADSEGTIGYVRTVNRHPIQIPAQSEVLLWARTKVGIDGKDYQCLVEPLEVGGLFIARSLATVHCGRVMIKVRNPNSSPMYLYRHQLLAKTCEVNSADIFPEHNVTLTRVSVNKVRVSTDKNEVCAEPSALPNLNDLDLCAEHKERLQALLHKHRAVFATNDEDYGQTTTVQHVIPTADAPPIRERYRQIPPQMYQEVKALIQGMLDSEIIVPSTSPWAAPIVLVRKKDGSLRFCVDYRKLNAVTHKDAYPLPRIEESLAALGKAKFFTTLDLASGYWQVQVAPQDREKTAFITPMGLYEFTRMPFGLSNAPATFQRLMHTCLGDQNLQSLLTYLDDVIIYSPDFDSHLAHLNSVLEKLAKHGLKLKMHKCHFLKKEVQYLGHRVSAEGISPDPEKVKCVEEWPTPKTVKELQSFLGLAGYYRRFIKDFAKIACPLNRLLTGISPKNSKRSGQQLITWDDACTEAFQTLKNALTSAPILAFADFNLPFVLYTDASNRGLGAVLCQIQDGKERVIAFASRSLSATERNDKNYSSFKLEFLALTWAITKKFAEYLYCAPFLVYTDNNPLVHLNSAKLGSLEQRWAARLASFQFEIKYKPGHTNQSADALSRFPPEKPVLDSEEVSEGLEIPSFTHIGSTVARAMCIGAGSPNTAEPAQVGIPVFPERTQVQWQNIQNDDPVLAQVSMYVQRGYPPNKIERKNESKMILQVLSHWDRLLVIDGVLHRRRHDPKELDPVFQILLPEGERYHVWQMYHTQAGHWGPEKTHALLQHRFFWPNMLKDITNWCAQCQPCLLRKAPNQTRAPLVPIQSSAPMELLSLDFLSIGHPEDTYHNVLVMVDHFTKFAWAVPTKDQTATTTAKVLSNRIIQQFGVPKRLLSDQGPNFESNLMKELCNLYGMSKSHTTPYHPAGNGACERLNRTLLGLLGTLGEERRNWHEHLPELLQVYNNSVHSTTGYTPHYLMFGRHGFLPQDRLLGLSESTSCTSVENWVTCHQQRLQFAVEKARKLKDSEMARQKSYFDRKCAPSTLQVGQKVLLQDMRAKGRGKLSYKWEEKPYLIVKQPDPSLPVYVIRQEGTDFEKVVHGNLLIPVSRQTIEPSQGNGDPVPRIQQGGPQCNTGPPWVGFWVPTGSDTRGGSWTTNDASANPEAAAGPRRSTRATRGVAPQRYRD